MEKITHKDLIDFGFQMVTDSPVVPYQKKLGHLEEDDFALIFTLERNVPEFGILTPDGVIFLNANLKQLAIIEQCITGYQDKY